MKYTSRDKAENAKLKCNKFCFNNKFTRASCRSTSFQQTKITIKSRFQIRDGEPFLTAGSNIYLIQKNKQKWVTTVNFKVMTKIKKIKKRSEHWSQPSVDSIGSHQFYFKVQVDDQKKKRGHHLAFERKNVGH